ncbi:S8 family serine peptidase, partial [Candidatus Saccharibacteria bacterium]|nr:S8 family serine peptidase [Candidatus Saccharibacteria bacterium]
MLLVSTGTKRVFSLLFLITLLIPSLSHAEALERDGLVRTPRVEHTLNRSATEARFTNDEVLVKYTDESRAHRHPTRGRNVGELLTELQADPNVEYAEPNYIAYAFMIPNDPYYDPYQWNFDNGNYGGVHAETAWDVTSGTGQVVAVVDTGVAYETYNPLGPGNFAQAPDLSGTNFVPGYDFVSNDTHPNDDHGHGTHVAGTIAGTTNEGNGVAGLAHGASIMPIKVLASDGSGSYADVADGIRYAADHGAHVINLSLGGPASSNYLRDAVAYAHNKGVTIVAAAGNDYGQPVSYPAAYDDH